MPLFFICPRCDIVCIEKDKDKVMSHQQGHGGWESSMVSVGQMYRHIGYINVKHTML